MLTEHFVAGIAAPTKPNTGVTKDAGIFVHELQPLAAQRHVFKKSATAPNGLAVSRSHVFAAQADKAVVHVYSREKGSQEALVPFPERIHSIALAAQDTVLLLGAESGRVLAWEICSGRLVSTATSHLQPVTCLAVDPAGTFFLSGSADGLLHVWALPAILSFAPDSPRSPTHTLAGHRGAVSAVACGHSRGGANMAVSVADDKTAVVWDMLSGQALRTYLLPDAATAVALDPADRAFHVAYGDGSLQTLDFYDAAQRATAADVLRDAASAHRPVQPSPKTRFHAESQKLGGALSLGLSWDGTTLVSGHASGKVVAWDLAKATYLSTLANLPGPVAALHFLPPAGFPNAQEPPFKMHAVVKPKPDAALPSGNALLPPNYTLSMQFTARLRNPHLSATETGSAANTTFAHALSHPSFPPGMLDDSLAELASWTLSSKGGTASSADFLALAQEPTTDASGASSDGQQTELQDVKKQLASLQRIQKVTFSQLAALREEKEYFLSQEEKRAAHAKARAQKKLGITDGVSKPQPTANYDVETNMGSSDATSDESESDDDAADET